VCGFATAKLAKQGGRLTVEDLASTARRTLVAPVTLGELADLTHSRPEAGQDGRNR
jgi:hypothetical protein